LGRHGGRYHRRLIPTNAKLRPDLARVDKIEVGFRHESGSEEIRLAFTRFENYVSEAALAHASGDQIEAAYARSDVLDKRRKLMDAWAKHCAKRAALEKLNAADKVVSLRSNRSVAP
jgi:hypothetical protein